MHEASEICSPREYYASAALLSRMKCRQTNLCIDDLAEDVDIAVERILRATDPASVPGNLTPEEKIRWLEAQNMLLRFHYTALMEHVSKSSPEDFAKKKR